MRNRTPPTLTSSSLALAPGTNCRSCTSYFQKCRTAVLLLVVLAGCRSRSVNHFDIVDFRSDQLPAHHFEDFDESYYRISDDNLADIVLRRQVKQAGGSNPLIEQIIHLRTYWKPTPGRTFASKSMLNANISYALFNGRSGSSYDGGGFMLYRENPAKGILSGELKDGHLQPLRQVGAELEIFEQVQLSGRFKAMRNDRQVTRMINDLERRLGPLPRLDHVGPSASRQTSRPTVSPAVGGN